MPPKKLPLYERVRLADTLTTSGIPAERAIQRIAFSVEAGTSFFHTIAKSKTLRILCYPVARAYHINTWRYADVFTHTRHQTWVNKQYKPNSNTLRSTTSPRPRPTDNSETYSAIRATL